MNSTFASPFPCGRHADSGPATARSAKLCAMLISPQLEFLMEAHNEFMAGASELPILLDGDTGYGSP